jgi:hypothetical protein
LILSRGFILISWNPRKFFTVSDLYILVSPYSSWQSIPARVCTTQGPGLYNAVITAGCSTIFSFILNPGMDLF